MNHAANHRKGFTLIELLLAAVITVLIAGSSFMVFRGVSEAGRRIESQMAARQELSAATRAIAAALNNAHRAADPKYLLLEGIDDSLGDQPADRIRFMAAGERRVRPGEPESDIREVEFYVESDEQDLGRLVRRTDPTFNGEPDGGGVAEMIADHVAGLNIEYHDGEIWRDEWPRQTQRWPDAIRISLAIVIEDRGQRQVTTVTRLFGYHIPAGGSQPPAAQEQRG